MNMEPKIKSFVRVSAWLLLACITSWQSVVLGQVQQSWVARYSNGLPNGTNQALKIALDGTGNVIITGFSQNTNDCLGYATVKYAPTGQQLWAVRFDSNTFSAIPAAIGLDANNNVALTGNAITVKYDANGNQLWTAPYAGAAVAVDTLGNVLVAGFSQDFGTVKLSAQQGSNIWLTTYVEPYGPTVSQSVLVDNQNNVYVSGLDSWDSGPHFGPY